MARVGDFGPAGRSHSRGEIDDGRVERGCHDGVAVGMPRLIGGEGVVYVRGGSDVVELVIPAPVDDSGNVEGFADSGASVPCDEVPVVVPGCGDLGAVADGQLVRDPCDTVSKPEAVAQADDLFVGAVDLNETAGAAGEGAVVAGDDVGRADGTSGQFLPQ